MTTSYHTDVAAGASATAGTFNAPLGQLDAHLNPTVASYASTNDTSTTVTTAGTYYAVAALEVSFTPAFTGQVFCITLVVGQFYASAAGNTIVNLRITDGAGTTVQDALVVGHHQASGASDYANAAGVRYWTAAAGDVGNTRKAKAYVTHGVNGTAVHCTQTVLQAVAH